jgi:hypothetical protein
LSNQNNENQLDILIHQQKSIININSKAIPFTLKEKNKQVSYTNIIKSKSQQILYFTFSFPIGGLTVSLSSNKKRL